MIGRHTENSHESGSLWRRLYNAAVKDVIMGPLSTFFVVLITSFLHHFFLVHKVPQS
jgi:hypothetical protein